jgi:anaerobic magnesium-protoporphyrin IX monomethyl ester cyclase
MKVILADPPALERAYDASYANLGLLYLAGYLRKDLGLDHVDIQYLGGKHNLQSHVAFVRNYQPQIYGISSTSKNASLVCQTIKAVKDVCPQTWIVCGGSHSTAIPEYFITESPCDINVIGEGELTFTEIVKAIEGNCSPDLSMIAGISYRQDGETIKTKPRPLIKNLDEIPFPAWDLIDFRKYPGMHLKKQPVESSLLVSRGCPFNCVFCSNPVWKNAKPWLRHRSPQNICEEIELMYERGVREIYMSSDELNFSEQWATDLCEAVIGMNHKDLYFQCNMRADKISKNLARLLAEMNCWMVHLGMESGNDRVLKGIDKHISVEQITNAANTLSRAGIKIFGFMMLYNVWEEDGRLCYETSEEVENSFMLVKKLFKQKSLHYMSWQFCTPMPGARLYDIALRHKIFRRDPWEVWENFDEHQVALKLPGISEDTMRWKIKKGVFIKDWFMVRSGNINFRHMWRVWENLRALLRR